MRSRVQRRKSRHRVEVFDRRLPQMSRRESRELNEQNLYLRDLFIFSLCL
jgi:hypothetical protein